MFGFKFGFDNFVLLGEVGYVNVVDMLDLNVICLNVFGIVCMLLLEFINGNSCEGLY